MSRSEGTPATLDPAPAGPRATGARGELPPGHVLGRWVIRQRLGEGGFADVYVAEEDPPLRRRVAIKILKAAMCSADVVARFEAERQALAMMDHPHVARVFGTGTSETGRPYCVLEFVPGESITAYCDRHRLAVRRRLKLFLQACEAVQHAHQKGIIHRDLKPSNVLVTAPDGEATVKVIDFGVAKAIGPRLTDKTIFTEYGQLIGTPAYMSPEQAEMTGLDIDTRSDIYSLGVLLYELLAGMLPFDPEAFRTASLAEIQRIIRDDEPDMPSARFALLPPEAAKALATARSTDPRGLARALRGDVDWITMKAIDKDRTRRYSSASELAADVSRSLRSVPVLAGPPSARYWLNKFVRRHKVGAAATSTLVFGLLAGLVFSTHAAIDQARARAEAEAALARLAQVQPQPAQASQPPQQPLEDDPPQQ